MSSELPLLQSYPLLKEQFARLEIGCWPTPVTEACAFAAAHGLRALWFKREDLSHPVCGGNKTRGLEFLLAEARRREARSILTVGAAGSHHVAATAWHARQIGIDTVALVTPQPVHDYVRRNLALGLSVGVTYIPVNPVTLLPVLLVQRWLGPWAAHPGAGHGAVAMSGANREGKENLAGRESCGSGCEKGFSHQRIGFSHQRSSKRTRPYYIPPGGTTPLACLGQVNAAFELRRQVDAGIVPAPDYLYIALGSMGTAAGLAVGCRLAGLKTRLVGVVVSYRWYCTARRWARLGRRTIALMRRCAPNLPDIPIATGDLTVVSTALGAGYARVTEESQRLADEMRAGDGLILDGTYTAKLLHGMVQFIERNRLHEQVHLFWHSFHEPPADGMSAERVAGLSRAIQRYFPDGTP